MVQCISALMELCYLFRRNAITNADLDRIQYELERLQKLRDIFIRTGVRDDISLPRQHALQHYLRSIMLFGSPNGLCSSITESKHIVAVKEPWRRSNHYKALVQMLCTISRLDKLAALQRVYTQKGMLAGTTSAYVTEALQHATPRSSDDTSSNTESTSDDDEDSQEVPDTHCEINDIAAVPGPRALSSVTLSSQIRESTYLIDVRFIILK